MDKGVDLNENMELTIDRTTDYFGPGALATDYESTRKQTKIDCFF